MHLKTLEPYPEVMKGLKTKKEEFVRKIINTKPAANSLDELGKQYKLLYGSELKIYRRYVQTGNNPGRDKTIKEEHDKRQQNGQNPPLLYVIDSRKRTPASVR